MPPKMKLIYIPKWLKATMDANRVNENNFRSILSSHDLAFYTATNDLFKEKICGTDIGKGDVECPIDFIDGSNMKTQPSPKLLDQIKLPSNDNKYSTKLLKDGTIAVLETSDESEENIMVQLLLHMSSTLGNVRAYGSTVMYDYISSCKNA